MDIDGLRKRARKHVVLNASIVSIAGNQAVRIKDLATSGVQIYCDNPPRAGSEVIFSRGTVFAAARVAWTKAGSAGLEFYKPLDPAQHGAEWD